VDLPGFNTEDHDARKIVETIAMNYMGKKGTILLHVCRADLDHNVQAGNDIVKMYKDVKKLCILT